LIKSVCVYCGSQEGRSPAHAEAAAALGRGLAERGLQLVYGGGRVGLMGIVADACLSAGGRVVGIIPDFLRRFEVGHGAVSELVVVDSMHERKQAMFDRSDAFAVLPGGFGTLDETFEMMTWRQLGLHAKPIAAIDIEGFWQPFQGLIDHLIAERFARPETRALLTLVPDVAAFFALLAADQPSVKAAANR
jgi:uncharacterized protein (TIGR00730 family)